VGFGSAARSENEVAADPVVALEDLLSACFSCSKFVLLPQDQLPKMMRSFVRFDYFNLYLRAGRWLQQRPHPVASRTALTEPSTY
jgi:hypothetical protein